MTYVKNDENFIAEALKEILNKLDDEFHFSTDRYMGYSMSYDIYGYSFILELFKRGRIGAIECIIVDETISIWVRLAPYGDSDGKNRIFYLVEPDAFENAVSSISDIIHKLIDSNEKQFKNVTRKI